MLVLATGSYTGRITFHQGAYYSGRRAAEDFSVLPDPAAAMRCAISGRIWYSSNGEIRFPTISRRCQVGVLVRLERTNRKQSLKSVSECGSPGMVRRR